MSPGQSVTPRGDATTLKTLTCVLITVFFRGEIPDMSKILDKDDFTIMKRAIYATQVRPNALHTALITSRVNSLLLFSRILLRFHIYARIIQLE